MHIDQRIFSQRIFKHQDLRRHTIQSQLHTSVSMRLLHMQSSIQPTRQTLLASSRLRATNQAPASSRYYLCIKMVRCGSMSQFVATGHWRGCGSILRDLLDVMRVSIVAMPPDTSTCKPLLVCLIKDLLQAACIAGMQHECTPSPTASAKARETREKVKCKCLGRCQASPPSKSDFKPSP